MEIKTTGQLRKFLAETMCQVKSGEIDIDRAGRITKLAGQINESFYAEMKVVKLRADAGEVMVGLGALKIDQDKSA